jgi:hypothetical protein
MLSKVVSSGQSGADQAALRAAKAAGIPTGGWAAAGWLIEDDDGLGHVTAPWLAEFGLSQCEGAGYAVRTEANVRDSDGTLLFLKGLSPGALSTISAALRHRKPVAAVLTRSTHVPAAVTAFAADDAKGVARWVVDNGIRVLNVAGPRRSRAPRIDETVERFLASLFAQLKASDRPGRPAPGTDRPPGDPRSRPA